MTKLTIEEYKTLERQRDELLRRIYAEFAKIYFCGYRLDLVYRMNLFECLSVVLNGGGFCRTSSSLMMLAFRYFPGAKIVRGNATKDERVVHSWIEVSYLGQNWAVDFVWYENGLIPATFYYQHHKVEVLFECSQETFWSYQISPQIYARLRHPESSFLFAEIVHFYGTYGDAIAVMNSPRLNSQLKWHEGYEFKVFWRQNEKISISLPLIIKIMQDPNFTKLDPSDLLYEYGREENWPS